MKITEQRKKATVSLTVYIQSQAANNQSTIPIQGFRGKEANQRIKVMSFVKSIMLICFIAYLKKCKSAIVHSRTPASDTATLQDNQK